MKKIIDENVVFGNLKKKEKAAWSLLLMAGYLDARNVSLDEDTRPGRNYLVFGSQQPPAFIIS